VQWWLPLGTDPIDRGRKCAGAASPAPNMAAYELRWACCGPCTGRSRSEVCADRVDATGTRERSARIAEGAGLRLHQQSARNSSFTTPCQLGRQRLLWVITPRLPVRAGSRETDGIDQALLAGKPRGPSRMQQCGDATRRHPLRAPNGTCRSQFYHIAHRAPRGVHLLRVRAGCPIRGARACSPFRSACERRGRPGSASTVGCGSPRACPRWLAGATAAAGSRQSARRDRWRLPSAVLHARRYLEDSYIAYDPFSARKRPLCLGSNCSACGEPVCAGETCSFFYAKRFCKPCARQHSSAFPPQCHKLAPSIFGSSAT
jgi:hypothetical protein